MMIDDDQPPRDDICPNCEGDFSDRAIARMTQDEIELLEAGICPYCQASL
jgi:hypothetical protein